MNMPTLAAIASEVGVSRGAVSHVLNGRADKVSPHTRQRIEQTLRRYDYQPNHVVRAMKTRRTHMLGVIVPSVTFTFFPAILDGIEQVGRDRGYHVLVVQSHADADVYMEQVRALRQQRVDGILLTPCDNLLDGFRRLVKVGVPVVMIDGQAAGASMSFVDVSDQAIGVLATRHLQELGHQRIAYLSGPTAESSDGGAASRRAGYRAAMKDASLAVLEAHAERHSEYALEGGEEAMRQMLVSGRRFTAVVAPTDMAAIGALRVLRQAGRRVPDEVSLIGCGDLKEGLYLTPALTTISQHADEMGRLAARMLIDRIEGVSPAKKLQEVWIEPQLVIRESCAAPVKA